jgi:hypothetical protein
MKLDNLKISNKIEFAIDYGAISIEIFKELLSIIENNLDMNNFFRTFMLCGDDDVDDYCKRIDQEEGYTKNYQKRTLTKEEKIIYTNLEKSLEVTVSISFIKFAVAKESFNYLDCVLNIINKIFEYVSTINSFNISNIYINKSDMFVCKNKKTVNKVFDTNKINYNSYSSTIETEEDGFNVILKKEVIPATNNNKEV